ncbi:hypothetical protein GCM10010885_08510 [Alicyclobacillus cellulosilyticus]|uniref:Uncharacterized protein n=1 Tax=Alicyclobacillus cellulosilyticus TaxID=1003997 RepID=A0A917K8I8_9BACL|nr:hypothetical protein [Alicyclobacillus cellulosilyticus]GGJ01594.1 hypothetical protein GCM10010885_08510 [Alicyclobacillus cellulosilyticus]
MRCCRHKVAGAPILKVGAFAVGAAGSADTAAANGAGTTYAAATDIVNSSAALTIAGSGPGRMVAERASVGLRVAQPKQVADRISQLAGRDGGFIVSLAART